MAAEQKLVIDLSLPEGDPEREQMVDLTAEETSERDAIQAEATSSLSEETARDERAEAARERLRANLDQLRAGIDALQAGTLFAGATNADRGILRLLARTCADLTRLALRDLDEG